jgi:D-alanyl-D-alanine carboxypeptidase/D-alanyl-D-alanine-endopeptidase (penicillin-binding protein 4)
VHDSGITALSGDVVVDDRFFEPYRVPNGNLLITPVMLNENMVDVTVSPTTAGSPASLDYRPQTGAVTVANQATTSAAGGESDLELSGDGIVDCVGTAGCSGSVSGSIPADYEAPFKNGKSFVGTLRVDEPNAFMRTAFIEALQRNGVTVTAPAVGANPVALLPAQGSYDASTRVASYQSVPYEQTAKLVLKVSLNLGANLSLSLVGLDKGKRTIADALSAEREILTKDFKINGDQFSFPTNGSGTPDSKAAPRALVDLLIAMHKTKVAQTYQQALPILGVDGSLATTGATLPGKGHVFAKTGTTVAPVEGKITLVAQNLAGYIETKSGRTVAYALLVNNAGELKDFEADIGGVITDEGTISSLIYENL